MTMPVRAKGSIRLSNHRNMNRSAQVALHRETGRRPLRASARSSNVNKSYKSCICTGGLPVASSSSRGIARATISDDVGSAAIGAVLPSELPLTPAILAALDIRQRELGHTWCDQQARPTRSNHGRCGEPRADPD